MTNRHKEKTAHIRETLKALGIPARVRMSNVCGVQGIQVIAPTYDARFTSEELTKIASLAKQIGLTKARRYEIDVTLEAQMTGSNQRDFEYHQDLDVEAALAGAA